MEAPEVPDRELFSIADLGVQLGDVGLVPAFALSGTEHLWSALQQLALPPCGHIGMHVKAFGDLDARLCALHRLQSELGLGGG